MNDYKITCCSTADLTLDHLTKRDVDYISFHFSLNDVEYADDLGQTITYDDFYSKMKNGVLTKTSQVNADEFIKFFKTYLDQGLDILHLSISSNLSGTYNSANIAKSILEEEYPNNKIILVDTLGASAGYGMLVDSAADLKDQGMSIDKVSNWLNTNKLNLNHWFYSTDLTHYVRGGRITKTAGFVGSALNLCPILNMNNEGKLIPRTKVIGKKRVLKKIVDLMEENANDGLLYNGKCYISHADFLDDALKVKSLIEERFPNLKDKIVINSIGTTIGSHTGPGTLALFYYGKERNA